MKKTALLAAAAALFMATPAMAQSGGHVGLNYGTTETDTSDADTIQGDAAFGGASGSLGYQIDGGFGATDADGSDIDTLTLAGHLYWNGGGWRLGGVVASTSIEDDATNVDELVYGIEGSFDLGANTVLTGSYTVGETEFFADIDTWNADAGIDFYLSPNLRFGGTVGVGNLDGGVGSDADTNSFGVDAEWQPFTTPISFRVAYDTFSVDDAFGDFDTLTVGARWNWGGTLRERDNATPFDTRTGLFQRAYGVQ